MQTQLLVSTNLAQKLMAMQQSFLCACNNTVVPSLSLQIQEKFDKGEQLMVTIISAMKDEAAIAVKNMPK